MSAVGVVNGVAGGVAGSVAGLAGTLGDPDTDLADDLTRLLADVGATVRSLVGLSWRIVAAHQSFVLTRTVDGVDPRNVNASLAIPLAGPAPGARASELVLYASAPGAFRDLAVDPSFVAIPGLATVVIDHHLEMPAAGDTLVTSSLIGQATGVLLARGYSPDQADAQLNQLMGQSRISRRAAAEQVLTTVRYPVGAADQ